MVFSDLGHTNTTYLLERLNSMAFEKKFFTLILAILHLIFFSNVEFSLWGSQSNFPKLHHFLIFKHCVPSYGSKVNNIKDVFCSWKHKRISTISLIQKKGIIRKYFWYIQLYFGSQTCTLLIAQIRTKVALLYFRIIL